MTPDLPSLLATMAKWLLVLPLVDVVRASASVDQRVDRASLASPCQHGHERQAFDHYRLGNIIDVWTREFVLNNAPSIAAGLRAESVQTITKHSSNTFGNFLAKNPMATFLETAEKRSSNN